MTKSNQIDITKINGTWLTDFQRSPQRNTITGPVVDSSSPQKQQQLRGLKKTFNCLLNQTKTTEPQTHLPWNHTHFSTPTQLASYDFLAQHVFDLNFVQSLNQSTANYYFVFLVCWILAPLLLFFHGSRLPSTRCSRRKLLRRDPALRCLGGSMSKTQETHTHYIHPAHCTSSKPCQ